MVSNADGSALDRIFFYFTFFYFFFGKATNISIGDLQVVLYNWTGKGGE